MLKLEASVFWVRKLMWFEGGEERRLQIHLRPLAMRSEPVWNSRLRVAGGGRYKSEKEGKNV